MKRAAEEGARRAALRASPQPPAQPTSAPTPPAPVVDENALWSAAERARQAVVPAASAVPAITTISAIQKVSPTAPLEEHAPVSLRPASAFSDVSSISDLSPSPRFDLEPQLDLASPPASPVPIPAASPTPAALVERREAAAEPAVDVDPPTLAAPTRLFAPSHACRCRIRCSAQPAGECGRVCMECGGSSDVVSPFCTDCGASFAQTLLSLHRNPFAQPRVSRLHCMRPISHLHCSPRQQASSPPSRQAKQQLQRTTTSSPAPPQLFARCASSGPANTRQRGPQWWAHDSPRRRRRHKHSPCGAARPLHPGQPNRAGRRQAPRRHAAPRLQAEPPSMRRHGRPLPRRSRPPWCSAHARLHRRWRTWLRSVTAAPASQHCCHATPVRPAPRSRCPGSCFVPRRLSLRRSCSIWTPRASLRRRSHSRPLPASATPPPPPADQCKSWSLLPSQRPGPRPLDHAWSRPRLHFHGEECVLILDQCCCARGVAGRAARRAAAPPVEASVGCRSGPVHAGVSPAAVCCARAVHRSSFSFQTGGVGPEPLADRQRPQQAAHCRIAAVHWPPHAGGSGALRGQRCGLVTGRQDFSRSKGLTSSGLLAMLTHCGATIASINLASARPCTCTIAVSGSLSCSSISDKSLRVVAQLCPRLKSLDLSWARVSDEGITSLTRGACLGVERINLTVRDTCHSASHSTMHSAAVH